MAEITGKGLPPKMAAAAHDSEPAKAPAAPTATAKVATEEAPVAAEEKESKEEALKAFMASSAFKKTVQQTLNPKP